MKKYIFFLLAFLLAAGCSKYPQRATAELAPEAPRPKNIILLIGDGMGLAQISAGMYANGNHLNLERFPISGLQKPYSFNDLITDSAAGATSFASGVKTYNGAIGVDNNRVPVKTILEEAKERGMATGLISTSSITHATPAAFIAHVPSREKMEDIAAFFTQTDIDLFIGGGEKYFAQRQSDNRNLIQELETKGYFVSDYIQTPLVKIPINFDKRFAYFTAAEEPAPFSEGRDYLVPASKLATVFLPRQSKNGFFLMIEGSQIDWGGHANNSSYLINEMVDFDRAIGEVLAFAEQNDETLVIVTADHETGGYAIVPGSTMDSIRGSFTTEHHTAALIPVFAYGPGARLFGGTYENTEIFFKMRQALGWPPLENPGKR